MGSLFVIQIYFVPHVLSHEIMILRAWTMIQIKKSYSSQATHMLFSRKRFAFLNMILCMYSVLLRTHAPPKILIKLHVWSIYNLIKFPYLLSIRGACTPEKLFLSGAI